MGESCTFWRCRPIYITSENTKSKPTYFLNLLAYANFLELLFLYGSVVIRGRERKHRKCYKSRKVAMDLWSKIWAHVTNEAACRIVIFTSPKSADIPF